jgi:hypothetical protein
MNVDPVPPPPRTIGPDRVRFRGPDVFVESTADMPDWEFRTYRRTAVLFEGRRYFVSQKVLLDDGSYRYVLQPWTDDLTDLPGLTLVYDDDYVTQREDERREARQRDQTAAALFWVGPLLGFLPSRWKQRLNDRYAFNPVTVTLQSLLLERVALYALGALLTVGAFTGILGGTLPMGILLALVVVVDLVLRTGPAELGDMDQPGFGEWLLPSWWRRTRRF